MYLLTLLILLSVAAAGIAKVEPRELPKPINIADVENNGGKKTNDEGEEFFEGDMIKVEKGKEGGSDRNAIFSLGGKRRWVKNSNGIVYVPYTFHSSLSANAKKLVQESAADYAAWTCINFVPRSNQKDYIEFFRGGGCFSSVGRVGQKQQLSLGNGCDGSKGTPTHEMMHALGFYHEQSRRDRDRYVYIAEANVNRGNFYNFVICTDCKDPTNLPYDYNSVMHYGKTAFSKNGKDTIVPRQSGIDKLGQRGGLCDLDIKKLNWMYQCNGKTASNRKPNGGVVPCKVPYNSWANCDEYKRDCANPRGDYTVLENCPVTCKGVKKGDLFDAFGNCNEYYDQCGKEWGNKYCSLTCSKKTG